MTARTASSADTCARRLRDLRLDLRVQRVHLRPVQPDRRDLARQLNPHELAHPVHLHAETARVPAAPLSYRAPPGPSRPRPGAWRAAAMRARPDPRQELRWNYTRSPKGSPSLRRSATASWARAVTRTPGPGERHDRPLRRGATGAALNSAAITPAAPPVKQQRPDRPVPGEHRGPERHRVGPGHLERLPQQGPSRVVDAQHRPRRAARLAVPPEQQLVAEQRATRPRRASPTRGSRAAPPPLTTTGSGRYSSRPPAATDTDTRSTDSAPVEPGQRDRRRGGPHPQERPGPHRDPQRKLSRRRSAPPPRRPGTPRTASAAAPAAPARRAPAAG